MQTLKPGVMADINLIGYNYPAKVTYFGQLA